jgi:branched-chain amino acid transport system ATP-binding protein
VRRGEVVALLGANGAGKTTLVDMVSGLVRPRAGRITFRSKDITEAHYTQIVQAGLLQVPEGRHVFADLTVQENLELGSYLRARTHRLGNVEAVFTTFPRLAECSTRLAGTISAGEQQMLAIGRALMGEPEMLILDEPSLGLSPTLAGEMFALIRRMNAQGLSVLLVERNAVLALEVAHRAYVLESGAVRFHGTPAELLAGPELEFAQPGL